MNDNWIIHQSDRVLVTGAGGFVGSKVVETLLQYGFTNIRCLIRSGRNLEKLQALAGTSKAQLEIVQGNLLSLEDCEKAVEGVSVIYHLAVGAGGKSFPGSFMSTVIPTRNLLDACIKNKSLKRFVNVSSFAVYANRHTPRWRLLDESCPVDQHPERRGDAYAFAKLKQDEIVLEYSQKRGIPWVIVRPSYVYGPGKDAIPGRVGTDTFGIFLHLGGPNEIALTYVDNCADVIVRAGIVEGIDGEVFNAVDDDLPTSRRFLGLYKKNVKRIKFVYIPHALSYCLCLMWEKYSTISKGQLPPIFSRGEWHAYWKKTRYSNAKIKNRLGWQMRVPTDEALKNYFDYCRSRG